MFERIKDFFRKRLGGNGMENSVLMQDSTVASSVLATDVMAKSINDWLSMYMKSVTVDKDSTTLGLPAAISAEMARLVTLELVFEITDNDESKEDGTTKSEKVSRAEFINSQIQSFMDDIKKNVEYACAGGGIVFKPYVQENTQEIAIDVILPNDFMPLAFDSRGKMTSCAFAAHKRIGNKYYHKIEKHELKGTTLTVTNEAYVSTMRDSKGKKCSLAEVPEWASLEESTTLEDISCPLYSYFRIPDGNCVDPNSPLGVSIYARAVPQIIEADKQWGRYLWEFEAGETVMEASKDAFQMDKNGEPIIPEGKERLFWITEYEGDDKSTPPTKIHAPSLREAAIKAGLNTILQKVEFNSGLAYGTLSDPQNVDKTATEIKTSKQRSYSTISSIQKSLNDSLEDLIAAIDTYATLYELVAEGEYSIKATWDDSIVIDAESERARDLNEVRLGIMPKWEYRVKWYGEDEETAKSVLDNNNSENAAAQNPFGLE